MSSRPRCKASQVTSEDRIGQALGVAPVACAFCPQLDVQVAYWRTRCKSLTLDGLERPLLAVRVAGEARMSCHAEHRRRRYRSSRGTLTTLPPHTAIGWTFHSGGIDHLTLSIGGETPFARHVATMIGGLGVWTPDPLIRELTQAIADELSAGRPIDQPADCSLALMTETLLRRFIEYQLLRVRLKLQSPSSDSNAELAQLIEALPVRCGEGLTVAELAREAGMRLTCFNRRFKDATGITPHQYLVRIRLARVCDALRTTSDPIACIALSFGFSSQSHLTAVFHRLIGLTPQQYRTHVRNQSERRQYIAH